MTTPCPTLQDCQYRDLHDPLRQLKNQFDLPANVIYLDGNSLGVLPRATPARLAHTAQQEWGQALIGSWNNAGWFDLPQRVGNKIARLIGAQPGEVVAVDSTSINLFKVLTSAMRIATADAPERKTIVSERTNFPTDLYIAQGLCQDRGFKLVLVEAEELPAAMTAEVAVLMLTHVNYRTGAMHDLSELTRQAHARGILTVWDLAHSAGAVPVDLHAAHADFAVGCGYKYLNGGPGAPAFVWVHPRHTDRFWQPLSGWWGHAEPFVFTPDYRPAQGIVRYQCGTQPILSLVALECGVDCFMAAEPLGGMTALRHKSLALTELFMQLAQDSLAEHGLHVVTPQEPRQRGSQVSIACPMGGYAITQALIKRGVVGDFRTGDGDRHPDILRLGFTPLYTGFADVWHAVSHLQQVLARGEWLDPQYAKQHPVT